MGDIIVRFPPVCINKSNSVGMPSLVSPSFSQRRNKPTLMYKNSVIHVLHDFSM